MEADEIDRTVGNVYLSPAHFAGRANGELSRNPSNNDGKSTGMDVAAGCRQPHGGHRTMTLPVTASAQGVAHAQADAGSKANAAPARVARDYLVTHPDASENPFGKLVSQFAKGELPG